MTLPLLGLYELGLLIFILLEVVQRFLEPGFILSRKLWTQRIPLYRLLVEFDA